ncbi:MAG: hypothetical protein IJL69_02600, partial [Oscillospiraceae bacterium]|nr:hypothetical protein [Oscillospiraceae bacterium]
MKTKRLAVIFFALFFLLALPLPAAAAVGNGALAAPAVTADVTASGVKLSWSAVDGAAGYQVFRVENGTDVKLKTTASLTFTDKDVSSGTVYTYRVRASAGDLRSEMTTVSVRFLAAPAASAENTAEGVTVSWTAVPGATKYNVLRKTAGGEWTAVGSSRTLAYSDASAVSGTTYYYAVTAQYSTALSARSAQVKVFRFAVPSLSLSASPSGVTVKYGRVPGAAGYRIFRSESKNGTYTKVAVVASPEAGSWLDAGTEIGVRYYYKVRAYASVSGGTVYGDYSAVKAVTAETLAAPTVRVSAGTGGATVSFSAVKGAEGFRIFRATSENGTYTRVAVVTGGAKGSWLDAGVAENKTYYYKVRAFGSVDGDAVYGGYSAVVSVRTGILVGTPEIDVISYSTGTSITISWSTVSKATGYAVYRLNAQNGWDKIKTLGSSALEYTDPDASGFETYAVKALRKVNGTLYYSPISASYRTTTLAAPTGVTTSPYSDKMGTLGVTWNPVKNATAYAVCYKIGPNGAWSDPELVSDTSCSFNVPHGRYYYFRVVASYINDDASVATFSNYSLQSEGWKWVYKPKLQVDGEYARSNATLV